MPEPLAHVTPGQLFIPSAKAWNRFIDTARTVDELRSIFSQPAIEGGGADSSTRRVYIAQDSGPNDGTGDPVPIYNNLAGGLDSFICKPNRDLTGADIEVFWSYQVGVRFTGEVISIQKRKGWNTGNLQWEVADAGCSQWFGVQPDGAIYGGDGFVLLPYIRVAPPSLVFLDTCRVAVVAGDAAFNVAETGQLCDVAFDQVTGQFFVTRAYCPS